MDYKLEFVDKEITPFGGLAVLKQMLDKMQLKEILSNLPLPEQGSNRSYNPVDMIISFMLSVWCGANRFSHTEITRYDNTLKNIFELTQVPSGSTFTRFFKRFSYSSNDAIFRDIYSWFFSNIQFDNYTLDFDSSVVTRYGFQEGAAKGYNPKKPGRKSHHPIMAFIDDCNMIANFWLRPGNTSSANNFLSFLEDTLSKLSGKKVGLIRADSGFYSKSIFEYLEERNLNYVISAKFHTAMKRTIANTTKPWLRLSEGVEINDTFYKSNDWEKPRRIVIIRQNIAKRPNATGKQISLFGELIDHGDYRYSCFITNLNLPAATVWRLYRGRANAENRIKELKYDFGFDSFNLSEFYATEAALGFVMLAYNIMSLFKHAIINAGKSSMMATLRYKLFNISAYITKEGNSRILKLALISKRRQWLLGLWDNSKQFVLPYSI
jgi:hypothetical protein